MILNSKETTVIYRCPHCGLSVVSVVGVFTLSGDMVKLKCDCEKSELVITRTNDGKVRLAVPCLACGERHTFIISQDAFFEKKVLCLSCTYTGIDICFVGGKDDALETLSEKDKELAAIMAEAGLADFGSLHGDEIKLTDPETENLVRFMLEEFKADGCIHCKCPDGEGEYDFRFLNEDALVFCTKCNANTIVPLGDTAAATAFIDSDEIILR